MQFYNVAAYGPLGESFAATFQCGQRIVITGRLDCEHEPTLLGYWPLASVIAVHHRPSATAPTRAPAPRLASSDS